MIDNKSVGNEIVLDSKEVQVNKDKHGKMCCDNDERKMAARNYKFAIDFLIKIVNELTEESKLFKMLLLLDSDISINLVGGENESVFELSYIPSENLKKHLYLLLETKIWILVKQTSQW